MKPIKHDEAWTDDEYSQFVEFALHSNKNADYIREKLNNNKTHMSIWDTDETKAMDAENIDDSKSKYLKLKDGETRLLTFVTFQIEDQQEGTAYPSKNGKEYVLYFIEDGNEKQMSQGSLKGALISAMRDAEVKEGMKIAVTRKGEGTETTYKVSEGWEAVEEKEDEIAF